MPALRTNSASAGRSGPTLPQWTHRIHRRSWRAGPTRSAHALACATARGTDAGRARKGVGRARETRPGWSSRRPTPARYKRLLLRVALRRRLGPTLDKQGLVRCIEFGNARERTAALHHLAAVTFEDDLIAWQEAVSSPSLSLHRVGARELHIPGRDFTAFADVDIHAHVRVCPRNLLHDALELHLLLGVVFGIEPVMGDGGHRQRDQADNGHQDSKRPSHCKTSKQSGRWFLSGS